jgi:hypothetical protein
MPRVSNAPQTAPVVAPAHAATAATFVPQVASPEMASGAIKQPEELSGGVDTPAREGDGAGGRDVASSGAKKQARAGRGRLAGGARDSVGEEDEDERGVSGELEAGPRLQADGTTVTAGIPVATPGPAVVTVNGAVDPLGPAQPFASPRAIWRPPTTDYLNSVRRRRPGARAIPEAAREPSKPPPATRGDASNNGAASPDPRSEPPTPPDRPQRPNRRGQRGKGGNRH